MTIKDLQNLTLFMTLELRNRSSKICLVNPPPYTFSRTNGFQTSNDKKCVNSPIRLRIWF